MVREFFRGKGTCRQMVFFEELACGLEDIRLAGGKGEERERRGWVERCFREAACKGGFEKFCFSFFWLCLLCSIDVEKPSFESVWEGGMKGLEELMAVKGMGGLGFWEVVWRYCFLRNGTVWS